MKAWADAIGFAVTVLGLMALAAYMVIHDHPWFGLLFAIVATSVRFSNQDKKAND